MRRAAFLICAGVMLLGVGARPGRAEQRLYQLRVTRVDGDRYETISTEDPYTYASLIGGTLHVSRDYARVWSPQVKVAVVDTWIEPRLPLRVHWRDILRERGFLQTRNHKLLPRRRALTPAEMREPEAVSPAPAPAPR